MFVCVCIANRMELKNPTSFTRNFIHTHTHKLSSLFRRRAHTSKKKKIPHRAHIPVEHRALFLLFPLLFFWIYELCVYVWNHTIEFQTKIGTKKKKKKITKRKYPLFFFLFFLDSCSSSLFESLMLSTTTFHFKNRNYFDVLRTSTIQNETNKEYTE